MYSPNVKDENGETFIPASQRPDGTWRKARRVKEGYVPQEEVPLYESKGKQFVTRSSKPEPITLPSGQKVHQIIPGLFSFDDKEKKRSKKKAKNVEEISKALDQISITTKPQAKSSTKTPKTETKMTTKKPSSNETNNQTVDPVKRLRNLKKRLREVEALEIKLKNGEVAKPEPDQLAKLQRKSDLLLQISELEKTI